MGGGFLVCPGRTPISLAVFLFEDLQMERSEFADLINNNEHFKEYKELVLSMRSHIWNDTKYTHVHHIMPKCIGGDDSVRNLVRLSIRQHIEAHKLLALSFIRAGLGKEYSVLSYVALKMVDEWEEKSKPLTEVDISFPGGAWISDFIELGLKKLSKEQKQLTEILESYKGVSYE